MIHQLYVFGSNGEGQLGIPVIDIVAIPTKVLHGPTIDALRAIRSGDNHTLFHTNDGAVHGIGDNRKGQLAVRPQHRSRLDQFEKLQTDVSFIAATCESSAYVIIDKDVRRSCVCTQGTGQWGELGRGDEFSSTVASNESRIELPGTVVDFAAGVWHYIIILEDHSVYGWGKARLGQLGDKLSGKVTVPAKIEDLSFRPTKVVCGKDFTYLAGDPSTGEHTLLGKDKFSIVTNMPHNIKGWKYIGATWHAIFVLFQDGKLVAWGKENMWQLLPLKLPLLDKIAVGSDHILAVTKEGKLISWGWGKHGNCGDLTKVIHEMKNDMVSGFWNEIDIPGEIVAIGAGFCTSFVVTKEQ